MSPSLPVGFLPVAFIRGSALFPKHCKHKALDDILPLFTSEVAMGLFDQPEEVSESGELFDKESKIRLFETQQKTATGVSTYIKKFFPIAVIVLVGIGLVVWFMLPNVGDEVKGPYHLERALYEKITSQEKRTPENIEYFYCGEYYWARITVEKRFENPEAAHLSPDELARETKRVYRGTGVEQSDGTWQTTVTWMPEEKRPCDRN